MAKITVLPGIVQEFDIQTGPAALPFAVWNTAISQVGIQNGVTQIDFGAEVPAVSFGDVGLTLLQNGSLVNDGTEKVVVQISYEVLATGQGSSAFGLTWIRHSRFPGPDGRTGRPRFGLDQRIETYDAHGNPFPQIFSGSAIVELDPQESVSIRAFNVRETGDAGYGLGFATQISAIRIG